MWSGVVLTALLLRGVSGVRGPSRRQRQEFRVVAGESDDHNKYPYVLPFFLEHFGRFCTGTIIAPTWSLTASHCFEALEKLNITHRAVVIYGDLEKPPFTATRVLRALIHPSYKKFEINNNLIAVKNDIALALVEPVPINEFGKVSAVDFKSLVGYSVVFIGAGGTYSNEEFAKEPKKLRQTLLADQVRKVQIGHGVVTKCDEEFRMFSPVLCLRPKCNNKKSGAQLGDSGGPVVVHGKVVGVCTAGQMEPSIKVAQAFYTPVSVYLAWIQSVMKEIHIVYETELRKNKKPLLVELDREPTQEIASKLRVRAKHRFP